ncbi:nuclear transport factor 2 family protein [Cupriavidus sp. AU9028]|uniref:YybH family protein n=1 Tax=Cupriavidus sp. AU9028 TaxID=2871157 RepID=UPI001C93D3C1|nr:nuclear transport factor 2 family protein [Cupriavidus sp. AU9028]MBY4899150.1 nuclear transport factor 2 family protein [Cupriavidus sp. AU9028]
MQSTTQSADTQRDHQAIRDMLEDWRQACLTRDVARVMTHYANDIVAFDAIGALQFKGIEAYGAHYAACMQMCPGAMVFEIHQLQLHTENQIGYGHYLLRCGHQQEDGSEAASWMRVTVGLRRTDQGWRIAHDHFSAPFDPESGKTVFDLQP